MNQADIALFKSLLAKEIVIAWHERNQHEVLSPSWQYWTGRIKEYNGILKRSI